MSKQSWQETYLPKGNEDDIWELFHENSKISRYQSHISDQEVQERMKGLHESLVFTGYPMIELPEPLMDLKMPLTQGLSGRVSARELSPRRLSLSDLSTLLYFTYGVTRSNDGTSLPRPFRIVPSAGALYPLEIFFHTSQVEGLPPGVYHYNPSASNLRLIREGDQTQRLSQTVGHSNLALGASLLVFMTAMFERSVFKYGDRGYRFVLLEVGHAAQNLSLISYGLDLASVNIGGFFDREVDECLGLDGVTHSTMYMVAVGQKGGRTDAIEKELSHGSGTCEQ